MFFLNHLYIDIRAQMGRVRSAHLGHRTSFLITAITMRHAACEFHKRMIADEVTRLMVQWVKQRSQEYKPEQTMPLILLVF